MDETTRIPDALIELRDFLDTQGWDYCLIGGLAAGRWGEARFTHDIDVVVQAEFGLEMDVAKPLLKKFKARYPDAVTFAKTNRIVLVSAKNGIGIDISLGGLLFEDSMVSRATDTRILSHVDFRTARPEDIVVMKSIAGRPIDVKDIEGIIAAQGKLLDVKYIRHWLSELAELWTEVDVVGVFETAFKSVADRIKTRPTTPQVKKSKKKEN